MNKPELAQRILDTFAAITAEKNAFKVCQKNHKVAMEILYNDLHEAEVDSKQMRLDEQEEGD